MSARTTRPARHGLPAAPVLIIGDAMPDRYWEGEVERISPEAPVPILRVRRQHDRPGGAANVAANLVDLGHPVTLATLVGDDDAGERLAALLAQRGIRLAAVRDPQMQTIQKIRSVSQRQQLLRIDFEDTPCEQSLKELMQAVAPALARHAWVLLSDYAKGCLRDAPALITAARTAGCKVLVDPKGRDFQRYRGAFLLKPNAAEVRAVVGDWHDDADLLRRLHALREDLGVEHLLATRGERGMTLCSEGRRCLHIGAEVREVYDVSGAGDTVLAALTHGLSLGMTVEAAVRCANRAAGIVVGKFGTASITPEEWERANGSDTVRAVRAATQDLAA